MKEYLIALLGVVLKMGWAIPLSLAQYMMVDWMRCNEAKMLCSFPIIDMAESLTGISLLWFSLSILIATYSQGKKRR